MEKKVKMQRLPVILVFLLLPCIASAQIGVPGQKFAWDQVAPDEATAQSYAYRHYDDGAAVGQLFANVVCTGPTSPFQCEVLIPAFTPGSHAITLTASNAAGESPKSAPFTFTFVVTPGVPTNLHIK